MKLAAAGHTIALLTLTRGDAGLWLGKTFGSWSKPELAAERAKEWAAAVATIGYQWSRLLRYPDGGLKDAPADVITADIVAAIREVRPEIVCTFGPEGAGSEHDDHRSASYFAARGFPSVAFRISRGASSSARRRTLPTRPLPSARPRRRTSSTSPRSSSRRPPHSSATRPSTRTAISSTTC
jgi:LmbE family N-acetylglucosaminyl deacetylase